MDTSTAAMDESMHEVMVSIPFACCIGKIKSKFIFIFIFLFFLVCVFFFEKIDFKTLKTDTITIRERDTTQPQIRV